MAYRRITAIEAAEMINDGDMMALSGFTPNGNPKAIFRELSKRAVRLHDAGQPFQVGILTGASSCQSVEGDMAAAHALKFRAPFSTNKDFRTHTNLEKLTTRICTSVIWRSDCDADSMAKLTGQSSK